jgi:hypothetical protein
MTEEEKGAQFYRETGSIAFAVRVSYLSPGVQPRVYPGLSSPTEWVLKGPLPYGEDWPPTQTMRIADPWSPFRAKHVFMGNPG